MKKREEKKHWFENKTIPQNNSSNKQQQPLNSFSTVGKKDEPSGDSRSTYNTSVLSRPSIHRNRPTTNTTTITSNTQYGNPVIPTRTTNPKITYPPKGNNKECVGEAFFGLAFESDLRTTALMDKICKSDDTYRKNLEGIDEKQRNKNAANNVSFVQPLTTCDSSLFKRRKKKND